MVVTGVLVEEIVEVAGVLVEETVEVAGVEVEKTMEVEAPSSALLPSSSTCRHYCFLQVSFAASI